VIQSSPGSNVRRDRLDGALVVVKQFVGGDAVDRFLREVAAYELTSPLVPPVAPRLLDVDASRREVVLEDVPHRERPTGAAGSDWVAFAETLARLHAATGASDRGRLPAAWRVGEDDARAFLALSTALGVEPGIGVRDELLALVDRSDDGGTALLHGDPCIGNVLWTDDGVRLVDFEQAALGRGLSELAYLRIGFPTCGWVDVIELAEVDAAEDAYRRTWSELTGVELVGSVDDECVAWLLRSDALAQRSERGRRDQFARLLDEDWTWGPQTARQRLAHRAGVVAGFASDGPFRATTAHAARLQRAIVARWPDSSPLPTDGLDDWMS
jgi:hypothetical protein